MQFYSPASLRLRLAVPFLALVACGSMALIAAQHVVYARAQRRDLLAVARANASFLRATRFPPSVRLAENLSEMLHAEVAFRSSTHLLTTSTDAGLRRALADTPVDDQVHAIDGGRVTVAVPLDGAFDLLVARPAVSVVSILTDPVLLAGLAAWWMLALLMGITLSRSIVQPLRSLAGAMPGIARDGNTAIVPGMGRGDEIGLLARTYVSTQNQLIEEREKRLQAERFSLLGRMATSLAHEIQNPLAAIRLHTQLLQTAGPDERDAQLEAALPHLTGALDRASALVNQWLFLARPEPPVLMEIALDAFLDQALAAMAALFAHGGVALRRGGERGLRIAADPRRLTHVVQNLATNAVQAMGGAGTLDIHTRREGARVAVIFRDSGPGFSPTALLRAKEMLYSEKEGGLGVGLTVCQEVIHGHGGELMLANDPAGGAVVTVLLHAAAERSP